MYAMVLIACAQGSNGPPPGDDPDAPIGTIDGPSTTIDAPIVDDAPRADARPPDARPPDARPPDARPPDAGTPPVCSTNDDCILPNTCCFFFACVDGIAVGEDVCLPE